MAHISEEVLKELKNGIEYCQVADNLQDGLMMYFEHHILPGRFITACLENNLMNAMGFASEKTWDYIFNVMNFLYTFAPPFCWGTKEIVREWVK